MVCVVVSLAYSLRLVIRSRASLHLEIIALRHQRLSSTDRGRKLSPADRLLWLSQAWRGWRTAVHIVKPEPSSHGSAAAFACSGPGRVADACGDHCVTGYAGSAEIDTGLDRQIPLLLAYFAPERPVAESDYRGDLVKTRFSSTVRVAIRARPPRSRHLPVLLDHDEGATWVLKAAQVETQKVGVGSKLVNCLLRVLCRQ